MDHIEVFIFLSVASVALFSFVAVAVWSDARRREREAYYKSETVKKIAETQGAGGNSALQYLREEEKIAAVRRREGKRLAGLITGGIGIAVMVFFRGVDRTTPVYLLGLLPLLIGVALLVDVYLLTPGE